MSSVILLGSCLAPVPCGLGNRLAAHLVGGLAPARRISELAGRSVLAETVDYSRQIKAK